MRVRSLAKGMISFLPGLSGLAMPSGHAGGHTASAPYCYSVWLKHMTLLAEQGLLSPPSTVAELGPGSSIGVGLAALLSGADHYVSLDVVPYTSDARNLAVLEDLVVLFRSRAPGRTRGGRTLTPFSMTALSESHSDARSAATNACFATHCGTAKRSEPDT